MDTVYAPTTGLYIPELSNNYISTPDHADLDITGDLCIIAKIACTDWIYSAQAIISKWGVPQRSFQFYVASNGTLNLQWTTDGDSGTIITKVCNVVPSFIDGAVYTVAVTLDVDNGNSQHEVKFWVLNNNQWEQLGTTVVTSGTTSIYSGTGDVILSQTVSSNLFVGTICYTAIYNGIGDNSAPGLGTLVAEFDASKCKPRYRDSTGKIWSITGSDVVTERVYNA